jgi:ABC-2 type transport system permease protein
MSDALAAPLRFTAVEARLLWRDPASIVVPLGIPLVLMVMNGLAADGGGQPEFEGLPGFDAEIVPLTVMMIVTLVALTNLPAFLVEHRKSGWLRRLSVTPVRPWVLLAAQTAVSLVLTVTGLALALGIAFTAFGLAAPRSLGWAVLALALGVVALFAVGLLIAALARTTNQALAAGLLAFLVFFALAGGFGGADALPGWLTSIGEHLPLGAAADSLSNAWTGIAPQASSLAALAATAVIALLAAARYFRWT